MYKIRSSLVVSIHDHAFSLFAIKPTLKTNKQNVQSVALTEKKTKTQKKRQMKHQSGRLYSMNLPMIRPSITAAMRYTIGGRAGAGGSATLV